MLLANDSRGTCSEECRSDVGAADGTVPEDEGPQRTGQGPLSEEEGTETGKDFTEEDEAESHVRTLRERQPVRATITAFTFDQRTILYILTLNYSLFWCRP